MKYNVIVSDPAEWDIESAAKWWTLNRSPREAVRWYDAIIDSIGSLAENPDRFSLARENERFPFEMRALHFGLRSHPTHRVLFTIQDDSVLVLAVRHVAQKDVEP